MTLIASCFAAGLLLGFWWGRRSKPKADAWSPCEVCYGDVRGECIRSDGATCPEARKGRG